MYINIHYFYIKWTSFVHEIRESLADNDQYSHKCTKINDSWYQITNKHENPLRHDGRPAPLQNLQFHWLPVSRTSIGSLLLILRYCFLGQFWEVRCVSDMKRPDIQCCLTAPLTTKRNAPAQVILADTDSTFITARFPAECNYLICWGSANRIPVDNYCRCVQKCRVGLGVLSHVILEVFWRLFAPRESS